MDEDERIVLTLEADDEASQKIDRVTQSLHKLDSQSGSMGKSSTHWATNFTKGFENAVGTINTVTRRYNTIMSSFNRTVKSLVSDMGSAIYDFTSDSIKNFTEFSEQHAKTLGAMSADYSKTSEDQSRFFQDAQRLKEQAMQLGTYGVTGNGALMNTVEVSEAQTELIKAGIKAEEIADPNSTVTKDVLTFAQANGLDTSTAVEFATTLGNQFGIDKSDWGLMLDEVSHTADMSVIDVRDIITSMKWAGGITAGLDRGMEETLAQIAMLGDFGLKGSQAGTGIQALLTRILTGDSTVITNAQAEIAPGNALEKFYEFEKIAKPDGNLLPMADIIDELNDIMEDMTDEEQAWFAKKLFGLYQMKSAYALMNGEEGELNKNIDEITNQSKGTNEAKLSQLLESQSGQLKSLNNLWEGIKTDFGSRLNPFVDAVRDELFNFLKEDGNYEINFDNLHDALSQSCDLIEEKYGSAIAKAVQNIGDFALNFAEISIDLAPLIGDGLSKVFNSLFEGNIFGGGGVADNWSDMISNMKLAVEGLPEDLQGLGGAIVGAIDWFGKLTAINIASNIAELVSSLLQILTIGGAMINVAGSVVVNGTAVTTSAGTNFTQWGISADGKASGTRTGGVSGASAVAKGGATGSTIIGSADDVAKALGVSADDVIATIGKQATYSVDDVAKSLGSSADEVISALGITSKNVTKLSKFGKALGAIGIGVEAISTGYEAYESFSSGDNKGGSQAIGDGIGSIGGGLAGAKIGAAIGTAIAPGIGSAIGGVLGSIVGSIGGGWLGKTAVGAIYGDDTSRKIEASEVMTTKGAEYQETLNRLKQQYDALVQSGEEGSVAAYKLKSEIDNLDTALKTMGDVTVESLITKSEELAQTIDKIDTSHISKNEQADTDADQAKSQAVALDALPQEKNDDTKKIAQSLIDGINEKYDIGLEMDDKGGYNMTTEEIFNAIDTHTDNVKKDNNNDALSGYLSQYKDALSKAQIAKETEQEALQEHENHPSDEYKLQEWQLAYDALTATEGELAALSARIRQRYAELGYDEKQIDQIMTSLEINTKSAIEVEEYDEKVKLNGGKEPVTKKSDDVPEVFKKMDEEEKKKEKAQPSSPMDTILAYAMIKIDSPELANLGKTLSTQKIGTLDEKDWTIALSEDGGKEAYKQLATEDRKAFKDAYIKAFSQDAWDEFEYDVNDNRTHVQKYKDSESLAHLMVRVTKDNQYKDYYDKNLDKHGTGYNVWTGTEEQLKTYMQGILPIPRDLLPIPRVKGDVEDPYKLNDLDENSKNGINDGLGQYEHKDGKTSVFDEKIIKISSDDKQYDKNLDKRGNGYYVWAGTEKEYKTWSSKQNFTTDGKNYKGDVNNPYIKPEFEYQPKDKKKGTADETSTGGSTKGTTQSISGLVSIVKSLASIFSVNNLTGKQGSSTPNYNIGKNNQSNMIPYMSSYSSQKQNKSGARDTDTSKPINTGNISKACERGVVSGFTQYKSNESSKNNKMTANEVSINAQNIQLAGEINTPTPKQLSTHGVGNNTIKNEIDNQVSIDNQVHMQPQFNVSAPNVNVDVRVDREDRVVKQISILNPGQSSALNNWYSRTSSKYGKTSL